MNDTDIYARCHQSVLTIDRAAWNRLIAPDDAPFLEWEWFAALEESGSISPAAGWMPAHGALYRQQRLIAIAPLYVRQHSWGELVFDHGWQQVAQGFGCAYFPKLVGMVPATPCPAYRFLIDKMEDEEALIGYLLAYIREIGKKIGAQSTAFHYVHPAWHRRLAREGFYPWIQSGFRWQNDGYTSFGDYAARFNKNQRRNIRRERAAIADAGVHIEYIRGNYLSQRHVDDMHRYYCNTNKKFGPFAAHFLNRRFFLSLATTFAHRLLLCSATLADERALSTGYRQPVALSLLAHKNNQLYGRYWGERVYIDNVHFELCYYAPIEWAIDHRCDFFDPGIGGEHKIRRGLHADIRYTLLRFEDARMQQYLHNQHAEINARQRAYIAMINQHIPFREANAAH